MSTPGNHLNPSPETDEPRSPCVGVCQLDREGAHCTTCLRSLDEIAGWARFTGDEKRTILDALAERRTALQ
jgi:uncharacterized protein